jgi:site-specific DNA recombinase
MAKPKNDKKTVMPMSNAAFLAKAPPIAARYIRMSDARQEDSPERQQKEIDYYAKKHGYQIVATYSDLGVSGDQTEKRTGFLKMRDDAKRKLWDCVLCWNMDRFGRFDLIEAGHWIKPFKDAGAYLVTVDKGKMPWGDFASQLIYMVNQGPNNEYLKKLSANVTSGMIEHLRDGAWVSKPPYGYVLSNGILVPDDSTAAIVRELFARYIGEHTSVRRLAHDLTLRGIPSPRGRLWSANTVQRILGNRAYLGETIFNRTSLSIYHAIDGDGKTTVATDRGTVKKRVHNPQSEWIIKRGTHEPLVTAAAFAAAQERLAKRRTGNSTPGRNKERFLLTGLMRCANCGFAMCGRLQRGEGGVIYTCNSQHRNSAVCRYRSVPQEPILRFLCNEVTTDLFYSDKLPKLFKRVEKMLLKSSGDKPQSAERLRKSLASMETKIDKAMERYLTMDLHGADALKKIDAWKRERDELAERLKVAEAAPANVADIKKRTEQAVSELLNLGRRMQSRTFLRDALHLLVERIELEFEDVPMGKGRLRSVLKEGRVQLRRDTFLTKDLLPDVYAFDANVFHLDRRARRRRKAACVRRAIR